MPQVFNAYGTGLSVCIPLFRKATRRLTGPVHSCDSNQYQRHYS